MNPELQILEPIEVFRTILSQKKLLTHRAKRIRRIFNILLDELIIMANELHELIQKGGLSTAELEALYYSMFPEDSEYDIHDMIEFIEKSMDPDNEPLDRKVQQFLDKMNLIAGLIYAWKQKRDFDINNAPSIEEI